MPWECLVEVWFESLVEWLLVLTWSQIGKNRLQSSNGRKISDQGLYVVSQRIFSPATSRAVLTMGHLTLDIALKWEFTTECGIRGKLSDLTDLKGYLQIPSQKCNPYSLTLFRVWKRSASNTKQWSVQNTSVIPHWVERSCWVSERLGISFVQIYTGGDLFGCWWQKRR